MALTRAQQRFVDIARQYGAADDGAEYWPVANEWVKDRGSAAALALRNINRTTDALIRAKVISIDDDGYIHLAT